MKRRTIALTSLFAILTLAGSVAAYTAIQYQISAPVTIDALMTVAGATEGTQSCSYSGLAITCPAYSALVGASWTISFTVSNKDSVSHPVDVSVSTQDGGAVVSIGSISPSSGTSVGPGSTTTFTIQVSAVGPGSDTVSFTITA